MNTSGVSVSIQTPDGWPVPDAILTLADLSGQQAGIATTDEAGQAALGAAPGQYTAILTAPGFGPAARMVTVAPDRFTALGALRLERVATGTALPEPGTWTIDPVHSAINVTARHAGISSVRGRFNEFGGTVTIASPVEQSTLQVTIEADSVDTASKMRDDHLRSPDFLSVSEFPTIRYEGTGLTPTGPDQWTILGQLTVRGETRSIELDLRYLGTGVDPWGITRAGFQASTRLRREDFRIAFAQRLTTGIPMVASTMRLDLDVELVQGDSLPQM